MNIADLPVIVTHEGLPQRRVTRPRYRQGPGGLWSSIRALNKLRSAPDWLRGRQFVGTAARRGCEDMARGNGGDCGPTG